MSKNLERSNMNKISINMLSNADSIKGQGVGSAYKEQVKLVKDGASDLFDVTINAWEDGMINHFHSIDIMYYLRLKTSSAISVVYVHFLPETLDGSISLPKPIFSTLKHYVLDFYRSADYCIVVNPIFIDKLVAHGIQRERIMYIPNFVSKDEFNVIERHSDVEDIRRKYKIPTDKFMVMGVGQVQTRKGVLDFVEIAKQHPDKSFVWAGGFSFGVITDGYRELKKVLENPPSNVYFLDIVPREEMNALFNLTDVLFMPSYNELFPMSILEASNTNTPIILRDLELYDDILFDFYLKGHTNEDFSKLIQKLADDKEFYQEGERLSQKISDFYSKENVLKQWVDFYTKIYRERNTIHSVTLRKSTNDYERILSGKKTMLIDGSSMNRMPFGKIIEGDTIHFSNRGSSQVILKARIKTVVNYEYFDEEETLRVLLSYQDVLQLTAKDIKKYASKLYLTFVEIDEVEAVDIKV